MVSLQESLDAAEKRAHDGELIRRKLHNTIQELKGNIRVFCRVRPLNATEQVREEIGVCCRGRGYLQWKRGGGSVRRLHGG